MADRRRRKRVSAILGTTMSKLETSVAKTGEEPSSKRAVGGLQAAAAGVVEFIGVHLTKGSLQVAEVKQTRQEIAQMAAHVKTAKGEMAEHVKFGKGEISRIAADVNIAKLAILAGLCLYGFCAAGSLLKNIFQRGNGGGNDRGDAGVQRQLVLVVPPRE